MIVRDVLAKPRRRSSLTPKHKRKLDHLEEAYFKEADLPTARLCRSAILEVAKHTRRPRLIWFAWRRCHPAIVALGPMFLAILLIISLVLINLS